MKGAGIEILTLVLQSGEPGQVIDAGAFPIHLRVRNAGVLGEQLAGALHGVTKAHHRHR
jgi:hypothetical protein